MKSAEQAYWSRSRAGDDAALGDDPLLAIAIMLDAIFPIHLIVRKQPDDSIGTNVNLVG